MDRPAVRRSLAAVALLALAGCPRSPAGTAARDGGGAAAPPRAAVVDAGRDPCEALEPAQRAMVVARVGESTLTLCDFARRINTQDQYLRARFQSPEQRRALLTAWVDSELLAAEARARGLEREPSVQHAIASQLARELEGQLRGAVPPPMVTEAEVERYYNDHRDEYQTPEQVRASHLVVGSRERAERVLADARAHAASDEHWRDLVRRETADAITRDLGGDLGFFPREGGGAVPPEVAAAAFGLRQPGDVAERVVESAHGGPNRGPGFHIVRFTARRDAMNRSLDEVRRSIRNRLFRERFDAAQDGAVRELVERLRREMGVTVDQAALDQVRLDLAPGVAPAMPGLAPGSSLPRVAPPPATR